MQKGEKKARKSLSKLGMKNLDGVTRVTLRKKDGFIFVINNPTVLRSGEDGNSFVVFGEIQVDDPGARLQMQRAKEMQAAAQAAAAGGAVKQGEAAADSKATPADDANVSADGANEEHIKLIMDHSQCTRSAAIKALKDNDNDMVNAVMSLTK